MQPFVDGYDELRLTLDPRDDGAYDVVARTDAAAASSNFALPFNELEVENFILRVGRPRGRRRIDASAMGEARRFGAALFTALFRGEVDTLYRDALDQARRHGRGVRITLCLSGSPELIDVPWEYLFDDPDFLAVSAFTPVVRYLELPRSHRPLRVESPLRVLAVVSSPAEYERLDVESERDHLERALSDSIDAGAIELHWLKRPTLGALLKALQTQTFHALHYIGHGAYDREAERGVLMFEDESGWARPVSGDKLGMILHDFWSLRLVVLNACEGARTGRSDPFAGVAGALVQRDIPAVVAMQFEISDEAAIVFAGGFYRPLAAGLPVDASLAAARLAILAERSDDIEWGTPVLFMRVPDGRIFDTGGTDVAALPSPPTATRRSRARHYSRRQLLATGALTGVLAIAVGAVAVEGGGASAHRASSTTSAPPFTITHGSAWRVVAAAVPGVFALSGSAARSGSDPATRSATRSARLVSGSATLAAGRLVTSAAVPGGVPPALAARYGRPLAAVDARIAGHAGREYTWSAAGGRVVADVLPMSAGDGAIICQAPTSAAAALRSCGAVTAHATVANTQILAPGPDHEVALAIAGPLKPMEASRSAVGRLRRSFAARGRAAASVARAEGRAAALLATRAVPPRYRAAIARLVRALSAEATAFTGLANAARASDRHAYARGVGRVTAASRALQAATRSLRIYQLGVPTLGMLQLAGPPPAPQPSPAVTGPAPPATTSGASSGSSSSPAPPAGGSTGNGTSTTYVTPFS